jgi:hypothetical protein
MAAGLLEPAADCSAICMQNTGIRKAFIAPRCFSGLICIQKLGVFVNERSAKPQGYAA